VAETNGDKQGTEAAPGVDAFFRECVCERHPDKPWPHDDCPGPGMPPPSGTLDDENRDGITAV
jgi:hypothetical protein